MSDTKPSTPEYRAISSLHNWENNPRTATKDGIERLIKQIKKLGVYKPLLITEDGTVLGGNMRLKALEQMGEKKVWVSVVQADTEEKKIEYALSDNDRVGKYEGDQLANLIGNFPEVEWGDYSVDIKEPELVSDLMDSFKEVEEDDAPEVETGPAESKLGEVYQLGRHRVMCGDSTDAGSVAILMNGQKADMGFCDPPYNLGFEYNSYDDNKTEAEYSDFTHKWFSNLKDNTERQVITLGTKNIKLALNMKADLAGVGCWVKKNWITACKIAKLQQWEPIAFYGDFTDYKRQSDLFEINRVEQKDVGKDHTCPKQMELMVEIIKYYSSKSVLDLFLGSGSTLIACEQTNRINFGLELDPRYIDVIIKRWMKFTGQRASKTIDADGKPCNIPVKFADESFMESKTSRANSEVKKED